MSEDDSQPDAAIPENAADPNRRAVGQHADDAGNATKSPGETCALVGMEFKLSLSQLEQQLAEARADDGTTPAEILRRTTRLADIERRLAALAAGSSYAQVRDVGTVLADLEQLRTACERLNLSQYVAEADHISQVYIEQSARNWQTDLQQVLDDGRPVPLFEALIETTVLQTEAGKYAAANSSAPPVFDEIRTALRQALLQAIETSPPTEAQHTSWVTSLVDRGDMAVTGVDDDNPELAARQVRLIADDLQWHLKFIPQPLPADRRRLKRKLRQLLADWQELALKHRLNSRFGVRFVRNADRVILLLILFVVSSIFVEAFVPLSPRTSLVIHVLDGLACLVFLTEFFIRLSMVPLKWLWFRRHFLIDFVPSIPVGLIFIWLPQARAADGIRIGLIARIVRVSRLARYFRAFGLLARGLDRLARQYGHMLNQNVILYPTREELARSRETMPGHLTGLRRCREQLRRSWAHLLQVVDVDQRGLVASRHLRVLEGLLTAETQRRQATVVQPQRQTREIAAEVLIENFATMTPAQADAALGEELVSQIARIVRTMSWAPLRWLPILSSIIPRITRSMTEAEITAATARRCGRLFQKLHGIWFWVADLYGTVTPSEFVDRVGSMLVKSSLKPVSRMFLFGGLFLLTSGILSLVPIGILGQIKQLLSRYVGPTLVILGSVSVCVLAIGWWMRSVAREATEFYERSAHAQFLALTEVIRSRYLRRDAAILYDRVLGPEWIAQGHDADELTDAAVASLNDTALALTTLPNPQVRERHLQRISQRVHRSLVEAHLGSADDVGYRGLDTTLLLYRDWLDGAIFTDNDTRATSQLLGNPAIRQLCFLSERIPRRDEKALQKLDLVRQKSLFGGPYLWFNFISRSVAHSVASLLIDYNQNAIPLQELPQLARGERSRYDHWLTGDPEDSLKTGDTDEEHVEQKYVTTSFTALHFLDFDPQRDAEVAHTFGETVKHRLQRDRSFLIRRIFGTYPMHNQPKEQRVVNLYSLYGSWLSGGRVLFLPVFLFGLMLKLTWLFVCWVARSFQQIRKPELRRDRSDAAESHFLTAVRKIDRIRGPAVYASLALRMQCDPEYVGVAIPGAVQQSAAIPDVEIDLEFLQPRPDFVERVTREQQRTNADMSRLARLLDAGLLDDVAGDRRLHPHAFDSEEHKRATAIVYLADYRGVRSHLSALEILHEVSTKAVTEPPLPGKLFPRFALKKLFKQYWETHGTGDASARRAVWRAVLNDVWGAQNALKIWQTQGDNALEHGRRILGELLLHPGRILEQLVTLRAVQTLSVLDVLNYREHVYYLGRYAEMGDSAGTLLQWASAREDVSDLYA